MHKRCEHFVNFKLNAVRVRLGALRMRDRLRAPHAATADRRVPLAPQVTLPADRIPQEHRAAQVLAWGHEAAAAASRASGRLRLDERRPLARCHQAARSRQGPKRAVLSWDQLPTEALTSKPSPSSRCSFGLLTCIYEYTYILYSHAKWGYIEGIYCTRVQLYYTPVLIRKSTTNYVTHEEQYPIVSYQIS